MENAMNSTEDLPSLRERLVETALEWQQRFGVAPHITSAISEYDAALLVGCSEDAYSLQMAIRTAVGRGHDFTYEEKRYQVKANRPSGKPGSFVTLVAKAANYEWDFLLWVLYDKSYVMQEAWLWQVDAYKSNFDHQKRIAPVDMRKGQCLYKAGG